MNNVERRERARHFFSMIPHGNALGFEVVAAEENAVIVRLPYREDLIGDRRTRQIHGGALVTLVDQTSGAAVICTLDEPEAVATLDLRVDHLRPAEAGRDVFARAECYRVARNIAFVKCRVYDDDASDPVATSMSSFMRASSTKGNMFAGK